MKTKKTELSKYAQGIRKELLSLNEKNRKELRDSFARFIQQNPSSKHCLKRFAKRRRMYKASPKKTSFFPKNFRNKKKLLKLNGWK